MPKFDVLDNVSHANLKVKSEYGEAFGNAVNQALVFPTEFQALQREYPIYFRQSGDESYYAVVLLGLDADENLFLEQSHWNARYVPAMQMSGPFALEIRNTQGGSSDAADPVVRINLEDSRVNEGEGHSIFLPHGGYTPYFEDMLQSLRRIYVGASTADEFFSQLSSFGLIEAVTVQASFGETLSYTVPDLFTIGRERMVSLTADELHQLNQLGLLEHCFAILSSAGNMARLVDMKAMKNNLVG